MRLKFIGIDNISKKQLIESGSCFVTTSPVDCIFENALKENSLRYEQVNSRRKRQRGVKNLKSDELPIISHEIPDIQAYWVSYNGSISFDDMNMLPFFHKQVFQPFYDFYLEKNSAVSLNLTFFHSKENIKVSVIFALTFILVNFARFLLTSSSSHDIIENCSNSTFSETDSELNISVPNEINKTDKLLEGAELSNKIQLQMLDCINKLGFAALFDSECSKRFVERLVFMELKRVYSPFNLRNKAQMITNLIEKEPHMDLTENLENVASSQTKRSRLYSKEQRVKAWPNEEDGLCVFEFFSGIGGMRLALPKAVRDREIKQITAFDCSAIANAVYEHNFHGAHDWQKSIKSELKSIMIEGLTVNDVDGKADIWTMSPPCQPFTDTRGAQRKDHLDNRSKGLYHLMFLLLHMSALPRFIVVENVKGFVRSQMHKLWLHVLASCGYQVKEFVLSPHEVAGLPNSRRRYYCIARHAQDFTLADTVVCENHGQLSTEHEIEEAFAYLTSRKVENRPVQAEDETEKAEDEERASETGGESISQDLQYSDEYPATVLPAEIIRSPVTVRTIKSVIEERLNLLQDRAYVTKDFDTVKELYLPTSILSASWAKKMLSIVRDSDHLTFCFTKGYGKIVDHSAGSCLLVGSDSVDIEKVRDHLIEYEGKIRLFHPDELLALFGFDAQFSFPTQLTLKQQYGCIGNSVNVAVVKMVMRALFEWQ